MVDTQFQSLPPLLALQRSKTAPTPLVDSPGASESPAQWGGGVGRINNNRSKLSGINSKLKKTHLRSTTTGAKSEESGKKFLGLDLAFDREVTAQSHHGVFPPLVSPRHDITDDPFNLAGFFPSRPHSPEHSVEWAWRSPVEEEITEEEEEMDGLEGTMMTRSLSLNALDEYAREVIANESKFGILGLARVPSFLRSIRVSYFGHGDEDEGKEDERVPTQNETAIEFSPAIIDEPFDAETLCESMHSRRVASERDVTYLPAAERVPWLGLFSPGAESREAELGWASGLYTRILGVDA